MAANISIVNVPKEKQAQLIHETVLLQSLRNVSEFAVQGARQVDFPKQAVGVAYIVDDLDGDLTLSNPDYTYDSLTFKKLGFYFRVNANVEKQNIFDAQKDSLEEGKRAMARAADKAVYVNMRDLAIAATHTTTSTADIYNDIISMNEAIDDRQVPGFDRSLGVSNADYAKMLRTKEYTRFDAVGQAGLIGTNKGMKGEILGANVLRLTDTTTVTNTILYQKQAVAWAVQGNMTVMSSGSPQNGNMFISMADNFGWKVLQDAKLIQVLVAPVVGE